MIFHSRRDGFRRRGAAVAAVSAAVAAACTVSTQPQPIIEPPWWQGDASAATDGGADTGSAAYDGGQPDAAPDSAASLSDVQAQDPPKWLAFWTQSRKQVQDPSPFGSGWQTSRTTSVGLVQVAWQGQSGKASLFTCAVASNPIFGTTMTFPAAFVAAQAQEDAPIAVNGATWTFGPATQRVGLQPTYGGPMPATAEATHPAVVDGDSDGKPGVTLDIQVPLLGKQALYVAQRSTVQWSATLQPDGSLNALPTATHEQATLGATSSLLVVAEKAKPVTAEPAMELRWRTVPFGTTCAQLLANPQALIGRSWPP